MGAVEQTSASVESHLEELSEVYGSFSVSQTTLAVSESRYERERETAGTDDIDVYTKVHRDGEVLHVGTGNSPELPSKSTSSVEQLETAAREAVAEATDIECALTGLEQATILGIRNADQEDSDTIYTLAVVFEATYESGETGEKSVWRKSIEPQPIDA